MPGLTKNANHTIFIYGKMLLIHFSCNFISTGNCMKGLLLVIFHKLKLYGKHFLTEFLCQKNLEFMIWAVMGGYYLLLGYTDFYAKTRKKLFENSITLFKCIKNV